MKTLLKIERLSVKTQEKEILDGLDLEIKAGEFQAVLGPNASGKSTLANVICGNPKYEITKGKIFFGGKDITKFSPEKRAKMGIALVWQNPPAIKGVKLADLLGKISPSFAKAADGKLGSELLKREINLNFSGGEKKISELLQVLALKPKLLILDEIDSGLDIKKADAVGKIIKKEFLEKGTAVLMITHSGEMLKFLKPNLVNIMMDSKISCVSKDYKKVLNTIKKYGYEKCRKCK
jgi:Fe-S cluster assembly ATP-binding protein